MSKQSLEAFRQQLAQDPAIRQGLSSQSGTETRGTISIDALVTFANARGFDFTADEVRAHSEELKDADLDQVTGGAGYLKFGGVDGESKSNAHKEWIELESFSLGVHRGRP